MMSSFFPSRSKTKRLLNTTVSCEYNLLPKEHNTCFHLTLLFLPLSISSFFLPNLPDGFCWINVFLVSFQNEKCLPSPVRFPSGGYLLWLQPPLTAAPLPQQRATNINPSIGLHLSGGADSSALGGDV